jgi:hypothetical protein
MNKTNKQRLAKLESSMGSSRRKTALVIYDCNADYEADLNKIEADTIIALPDNGRRGVCVRIFIKVGSCLVSYS